MAVHFGGRNSSHHVDLSSLRLTGQSVSAVNPEKPKHYHRQDPAQAAKTLEKVAHPETRVYVERERQGFGGGFKILEEYRRKKMSRKQGRSKAQDEEEVDAADTNGVTKEEIFQLLNLGNADGSIGAGKHG